MQFLNPFLLWGLLALAVPILLLLFINRKKLVLYWAAYPWMRQALIQRKQRIKLTEILKLIAKLLLLAALVLLLSRPSLKRGSGGARTMVVIDTSPSMGTTLQNENRLEQAKTQAARMVEKLDADAAIYAFDGRLRPVVENFSREKALLKNEISSLTLSHEFAGDRRFFADLAALPRRKEAQQVMVFGDFQKEWFGNAQTTAEALQNLQPGIPVIWQQVDPRKTLENAAIESVTVSDDGAFAGRECFIHVVTRNYADTEMKTTVSLFLDGKLREKRPIRLPPHRRKDLNFSLSLPEDGWYTAEFALDEDVLPTDNRRKLALHIPDRLRVLAVRPRAAEADFPLDTYVHAAVRALVPEAQLQYEATSPVGLMTKPISEFDVVVTINLPLTDTAQYAKKLRDFVKSGGGLLAFLPAAAANEAEVFKVTAAVQPEAQTLDPDRLTDTWASFMNSPELQPEKIIFSRSLTFEVNGKANAGLIHKAGATAVSLPYGKGRVSLCGFLPWQGYGNLHYNPNFVQVLLRALWNTRNHRLVYTTETPLATWNRPFLNPVNKYSLRDEAGKTWPVAVNGVGADSQLVFPEGLKFGVYRVFQDGKEILRLAYNAPAGDSDPAPVTAAEIAPAINAGLIYNAPADESNGSGGRNDLGLYFALFLLAALALEIYAHFFRRTA